MWRNEKRCFQEKERKQLKELSQREFKNFYSKKLKHFQCQSSHLLTLFKRIQLVIEVKRKVSFGYQAVSNSKAYFSPIYRDTRVSSEWCNVLLFPNETRATIGGAMPLSHYFPPPRHASCLQLLNGHELSQGITACCHTGAADALIAQWLVGCQQQLYQASTWGHPNNTIHSL